MELTLPSQSVPKMLIANYNTALGEPWENLDVLRLPRILAMEIQTLLSLQMEDEQERMF